MSKVGGKSRNGETRKEALAGVQERWGPGLGGSGDERRALRHDLGHSLVAATRGLAARMDVRGKR